MTLFESILKQYWGYNSFRPMQQEVIQTVVSEQKDCLALLPTGGGKSVLFQVAGLAMEGICLVVTPLVALMKDQVAQLKARGIEAAALYGGQTKRTQETIFNHAQHGALKFLYFSPERIHSDFFIANIKNLPINLIAVDEAHCISQWGYDFRPEYLQIKALRQHFPKVNLLAVTATATQQVVADIQQRLDFPTEKVFKKSFARPNLAYVVRESEDKLNFLLKALAKTQGSAVVYVRSRQKTQDIAMLLNKHSITASFYHAGLENSDKDRRQALWTAGHTRVMVATNAFGMGIDKADVRLVVHLDLPDSIEAYFQEAGRAGRDGKKAYALLLQNKADQAQLKKRLKLEFPEKEVIKRIHKALGTYFQLAEGARKMVKFNFELFEFCTQFKLNAQQVYRSIQILQAHNYIQLLEDQQTPTRIRFRITKDELYNFQVSSLKYDDFVKVILRNYVGIFTDYVFIKEEILAKKYGGSVEQIKKLLYELSVIKLIHYIPGNTSSYIVYPEGRVLEQNLKIYPQHYEERKDVYEAKMKAMQAYAFSHEICRNVQLLHYFSDNSAAPCGQCDVCQASNPDPSTASFQQALAQVQKFLKQHKPVSQAQLSAFLKNHPPIVTKALQHIQDEGIVQIKDGVFLIRG